MKLGTWMAIPALAVVVGYACRPAPIANGGNSAAPASEPVATAELDGGEGDADLPEAGAPDASIDGSEPAHAALEH